MKIPTDQGLMSAICVFAWVSLSNEWGEASAVMAEACMGCRLGHRGRGAGSDRCGLVLSVGQVCDSVGDCGNVLLDADSAHAVP